MKKENEKRLNIVSSDKLLKKKFPAFEFIVNGLIPEGGITIISGNPSCGKSWILLEIAKKVGSGHKLFNLPYKGITSSQEIEEQLKFDVKQYPILYLDEETTFPEIQRRWAKLQPPKFTQVDFMSMEGWKIDKEQDKEKLLDLIKKRKYKLVIFDSLIDFHSRNENDATDAQLIIDCLRSFTRENVTVLVTHHHRKEIIGTWKNPDLSQMLRGSSAILGGIDSLLAIEKIEETAKRMTLTITQAKLRQGKKLEPFRIDILDNKDRTEFKYIKEIKSESTKKEELKELIVIFLEETGSHYMAEIIEQFLPQQFGEKTIKRSWKELKDDEIVILKEKIGTKSYYELKE